MKNPLIFVTSTSLNYARAAIARTVKAGFFYSSAKGGISIPISGGLSLPSPKKGIMPAQVDLLTAVSGRPLFHAYKRQTVHTMHTEIMPPNQRQQIPTLTRLNKAATLIAKMQRKVAIMQKHKHALHKLLQRLSPLLHASH